MDSRNACLIVVTVTLWLLAGCVAKEDYLRKTAEAESLARQVETLTNDNVALTDRIRQMTAETDALVAQRQGMLAERERLTREQEALTARMADQNTVADQTEEKLKNRTAELEGDIQMLQESIALLKKNKEEELQSVSATYENLLKEMKEETRLANARCEETVKEMKEEVRSVSSTYEDLLGEMSDEVKQGQVTITELKGKLTVNVLDKILFNSGQVEIKPEGMAVLDRVADILKTVADHTIRVEGHTDNVPIGGALARRFPSNWELSAARAINVIRYLEKKGIDPSLLSAAAYGEHQPVAENDTPEGRAKNRRIAITLLPLEAGESE